MKTATMGVKLDENVRDRLKSLGAARERTPHWLMKKAIMEYLDKEEAYEHEKHEDQQRWQRYQETGDYVKHEDMRRHLLRLANQAHGDDSPGQ